MPNINRRDIFKLGLGILFGVTADRVLSLLQSISVSDLGKLSSNDQQLLLEIQELADKQSREIYQATLNESATPLDQISTMNGKEVLTSIKPFSYGSNLDLGDDSINPGLINLYLQRFANQGFRIPRNFIFVLCGMDHGKQPRFRYEYDKNGKFNFLIGEDNEAVVYNDVVENGTNKLSNLLRTARPRVQVGDNLISLAQLGIGTGAFIIPPNISRTKYESSIAIDDTTYRFDSLTRIANFGILSMLAESVQKEHADPTFVPGIDLYTQIANDCGAIKLSDYSYQESTF